VHIRFCKAVVSILTVALIFSHLECFCESASANADTAVTAELQEASQTFNILTDYGKYTESNNNLSPAETEVSVSGGAFVSESESSAEVADYQGKSNALLWKSGKGMVTWELEITADGLYNFAIIFLPLKDGTDIELGLYLDGKIPFSEAQTLTFTRDWVNATKELRTDTQGNEIAPEQVMNAEYAYRLASDDTGVVLEPYTFALTAGKHTVTLEGFGYPIAIAELSLRAPEITRSYSSVSQKYDISEDISVEPIVIHAEDAVLKSDKTLIPKAANGNAGMYPVDPYLTKINNIGGGSWNEPGEKITWNFTVKKAGYYNFGARYKQNELVGGESWRRLKIDGKTPFDEAKELRFNYGTGWQYYEFGNGKEPYYIWLDEGEHTLSLEVTLGELSKFYDRLNKATIALGNMYLEIVMITGETPDTNRDYELFTQIPTFTAVLTEVSEELSSLVEDFKTLTGSNGSQYTAAINNMKRVIDKMLSSPYIAHIYVKDYYTNYTTLSSWLGEMKKMPLALDEMQFIYAGQKFDWKQPNVFQKLWFGIKRLAYSYTNDYIVDGTESGKSTLKLWVNWGRDQTMALDSLIRDSFTAETGIKVELQIVSNSLINGLLANNYPDLQLHLARTDPVNYGMRGALLDLTTFKDYKEILGRFQDSADIPYWYNGALYALPDTQTFYTMFYRTDVFEKLGLEVPTTWNEFLYCATIIQRYNMNVYVPYTQITTTTTVNSGIGSLNLYPTLMLQAGENLYNKELNATNLITSKGIGIFEEWTKMYTDYGYLKEADFYNRFRNGSMPLGIAPYTTYFTIYSAAPEIQGRWSVANVPGITEESNYIAGGGTGCSIVKASKHKEEAWKFLKWWTSAETQARYSNNVESILGMLGRIATANVEAFQSLSWNPDDLEKLLSQWKSVREVPEVPGSYYLTRAVDQAYWAVINDGDNPKNAITEWSQVADNEIARKIKEYS
jgi:ABC-type glycerol-3-phosphate transport system substrate-binding protein